MRDFLKFPVNIVLKALYMKSNKMQNNMKGTRKTLEKLLKYARENNLMNETFETVLKKYNNSGQGE